jgi:hypothetical protein
MGLFDSPDVRQTMLFKIHRCVEAATIAVLERKRGDDLRKLIENAWIQLDPFYHPVAVSLVAATISSFVDLVDAIMVSHGR